MWVLFVRSIDLRLKIFTDTCIFSLNHKILGSIFRFFIFCPRLVIMMEIYNRMLFWVSNLQPDRSFQSAAEFVFCVLESSGGSVVTVTEWSVTYGSAPSLLTPHSRYTRSTTRSRTLSLIMTILDTWYDGVRLTRLGVSSFSSSSPPSPQSPTLKAEGRPKNSLFLTVGEPF